MEQLMHTVGALFLHECLDKAVADIAAQKLSCEVDPSKVRAVALQHAAASTVELYFKQKLVWHFPSNCSLFSQCYLFSTPTSPIKVPKAEQTDRAQAERVRRLIVTVEAVWKSIHEHASACPMYAVQRGVGLLHVVAHGWWVLKDVYAALVADSGFCSFKHNLIGSNRR
jgi:hypothetical protein